MVKSAEDEDDSMIVLPAQLDLTAAEPLHQRLLDRARSGDPLVIGAAAVDRVSTAAVQVLLAAAAEVRSRGAAFQLRDPSPELAGALADLGVSAAFGS
jgi:anti-anti-sigma regulatory factor